jgi:hypothetical protein
METLVFRLRVAKSTGESMGKTSITVWYCSRAPTASLARTKVRERAPHSLLGRPQTGARVPTRRGASKPSEAGIQSGARLPSQQDMSKL